ncbi:MAG: alpha/beta fold hydrolase, partial [Pseudomonadales bacterium]|nr:alpha/beta fold hydrolase [Pseudomonadales bacterium]
MRQKVTFESQGTTLSGLLERPESGSPCFALFAHCFTCGKDVAAASRIARALTRHGIAVLRFDFTGLGNSDGDFANTNFSSNLDDLVAAADYLRREYEAPQLLIGHSLGGAAILSMAQQVPEAKALVTIGAPFNADHVLHNFSASLAAIERDGVAEVTLGERRFQIKKQFLDDLDRHTVEHISQLRKALLVMHSPVDTVVSINEAELIYREAKHPKSFVSLDRADHLLSRAEDAEFVAATIAGWGRRYLDMPKPATSAPPVAKGHVIVEEKDHRFTQHVTSDSHYWLADEPYDVGGNNTGPDPYEHLLAALGACTSMTIRLYANRKGIALENIRVELRHTRNYIDDCEGCEATANGIEAIERTIALQGKLSGEQRQRMLEIADRCPV